MTAPNKSTDFDHAYRSPVLHWVWTDIRIPTELKALVRQVSPQSALELGCGVGRFSDYLAQRGIRTTGVDFSPAAIERARKRRRSNDAIPEFFVGDVTRLDALDGPFDVSFDVGCFHCLDPLGRQSYASEVARLLKPGGIHLIWALDSPPSGAPLSPTAVGKIFASDFELKDSRKSLRRLGRSHWYWLKRSVGSIGARPGA
ncbi:SAM-dependent methyltransferase [Rhodoblastus acidophilus]|uniref:class I SAM-dependent methyltransferase n=1 Tax=Rhodoblastus acidophilus TaxID=1074 RepID=UPI0022247243|nr:class I SAM-dependent methyltransferase [Rhodoblastus acidophilus]MCW2314736.1 SAM-dependent methyltransferase [Rhodoblastus acidophilus]